MTSYIVPAGGRRIDLVAKAIYGKESDGTVEALLAANPGLARMADLVPEGTEIRVPSVEASTTSIVRQWE